MKLLLFIVFAFHSISLKAQSITPEQAKDYIGKQVTVCGNITGVYTSNKSEKAPTFLNMGGVYPNNTFTVVVFKDDAGKFSFSYPGRTIG